MNGIALDNSTQNKQVQSNNEPQILTTKSIRENRAMKQETWNISVLGHETCPKWGYMGITKVVLTNEKQSLLLSFQCLY